MWISVRNDNIDDYLLANILLLSTKVDFEYSQVNNLDAINKCIEIFKKGNNPEKLAESYLYRGKIYEKKNNITLAESDLLYAIKIINNNFLY